jgi:hypothetical protein
MLLSLLSCYRIHCHVSVRCTFYFFGRDRKIYANLVKLRVCDVISSVALDACFNCWKLGSWNQYTMEPKSNNYTPRTEEIKLQVSDALTV